MPSHPCLSNNVAMLAKKESAQSNKRSPADGEAEAANRTKKSRVSKNKAEEKKEEESAQADDEAADFDDIIEEPRNDSEATDFTFASLGQTMHDESSGDGVFSLDPKTEEGVEEGVAATEGKNQDEGAGASAVTAIAATKPSQGGASLSPCPRWGQTMTMIDHKRFIVYGGQTIANGEAKPLSDLFVFDMSEGKWTKPINCDGIARTWHTANFLPERQLLLCFGGEVMNEKTGKLTTTDQVMVLDTESKFVHLLSLYEASTALTDLFLYDPLLWTVMLWYPPTCSGQIPSGRSGHASCVLPQTNELVVFGGVKSGKWLNTVSILDTARWKWSTVKAVGDAPRPRSYHRYVLFVLFTSSL